MQFTTVRLAALTLTVVAIGALPAEAFAAPSGTQSNVAASSPAAASTGTTTGTTTGSPQRHRHLLSREMRGKAALQAVGSDLPDVAAQNGLSRSHLKEVLSEDHTAWLSEEGRLFYQEAAPEQPDTSRTSTSEATTSPATLSPGTSDTTVGTPYPLEQTFSLHSRPGASRTIFLDFDGSTVSNTGWNTSQGGPVADGSYTGFDLDGGPSTFSATERTQAQEVWREVSESYSPFDVDVTTQDPGAAALTRSSSSDQTFGMRVLITSQASARTQACGNCLGVAYVGTFDNVDPSGYYQPAWVFAYKPTPDTTFDPMIIAQAATHETGHTLGLTHDGTSVADYSPGTSSWGPVMGSSMNRAVTQFSKGEYLGANNQQDDLAIIQTNGLALRNDDYGDTPATAERLGQQAAYNEAGVITTRADTDVFAVSLPCTGNFTVNVAGIGSQTAVDLSLQVLDSAGAVVTTSSPPSTWSGSPPQSAGMDASVSLTNATGTYYLKVDGVGNGNPALGGWSDYGSIGQYRLTATGCAATTTTPTSPTPTPTSPTPTSPAPTTPAPSSPPPAAAPRPPSAPRITGASPGRRGGAKTAIVRWSAPASTGGAAIRAYQVRAFRIGRDSRVSTAYTSGRMSAAVRSAQIRLPRGRYAFRVVALNAAGTSPWSAYSSTVRAR